MNQHFPINAVLTTKASEKKGQNRSFTLQLAGSSNFHHGSIAKIAKPTVETSG